MNALFRDRKRVSRCTWKCTETYLARWPWTRYYRRIIISFYWPNACRVPRFVRKTRVYDEKNELMVEAVNPVRGREQCSSWGHCLHFLIARHSCKIFAYHWWIYTSNAWLTRGIFFNRFTIVFLGNDDFSFHFFLFVWGIIDSYFEAFVLWFQIVYFFFFSISNIIIQCNSGA